MLARGPDIYLDGISARALLIKAKSQQNRAQEPASPPSHQAEQVSAIQEDIAMKQRRGQKLLEAQKDTYKKGISVVRDESEGIKNVTTSQPTDDQSRACKVIDNQSESVVSKLNAREFDAPEGWLRARTNIYVEPAPTVAPLDQDRTITYNEQQALANAPGFKEDVKNFAKSVWNTGLGYQINSFLGYSKTDKDENPVVHVGKKFASGVISGATFVVDAPIVTIHSLVDKNYRKQVVEGLKDIPEQFKEDPAGSIAELIGSFIGGGVAFHGVDTALTKVKGYVRTRGLPEVPAEKVVNNEVLNGKKVFAEYPEQLAKSHNVQAKVKYLNNVNQPVKETIEKATGVKGGEYLGLHATDREFAPITKVATGSSESPGLYVAPEASPYFLRLGTPAQPTASTSLKSLFGKPKFTRDPTLIAVQTEKVEPYPSSIRTIGQYNEYVMKNAGTGKNIITFASTKGGKPEMESIIPPETTLVRVSEGARTEWMGVKVPIRIYKAVKGKAEAVEQLGKKVGQVKGSSSSLGLETTPWGTYGIVGGVGSLISKGSNIMSSTGSSGESFVDPGNLIPVESITPPEPVRIISSGGGSSGTGGGSSSGGGSEGGSSSNRIISGGGSSGFGGGGLGSGGSSSGGSGSGGGGSGGGGSSGSGSEGTPPYIPPYIPPDGGGGSGGGEDTPSYTPPDSGISDFFKETTKGGRGSPLLESILSPTGQNSIISISLTPKRRPLTLRAAFAMQNPFKKDSWKRKLAFFEHPFGGSGKFSLFSLNKKRKSTKRRGRRKARKGRGKGRGGGKRAKKR